MARLFELDCTEISDRSARILKLIAEGRTARQIGTHLGITEMAVRKNSARLLYPSLHARGVRRPDCLAVTRGIHGGLLTAGVMAPPEGKINLDLDETQSRIKVVKRRPLAPNRPEVHQLGTNRYIGQVTITAAQRTALLGMALGASCEQISDHLHKHFPIQRCDIGHTFFEETPVTVKKRLAAAYGKLGVIDGAHALIPAFELGVLPRLPDSFLGCPPENVVNEYLIPLRTPVTVEVDRYAYIERDYLTPTTHEALETSAVGG
jgi:hypothetical protein